MEQTKLPNVTVSLILGIISYIGCCLTSGILGVILAGIGLYLANQDLKLAAGNPDLYENYKMAKSAKIVNLIGLILSALIVVSLIVALIVFGGIDGYYDWIQEMQAQQAEM